jgi:hypothetical protein
MSLYRHLKSITHFLMPARDDDLPFGSPEPTIDEPLDASLYLGAVTARQRGLAGAISLEVMLAPDGRGLEIGPFRLDARQIIALKRLLEVSGHLLSPSPPPSESGRGIAGWDLARNPTGFAVSPPWEGETLP